MTEAAGYFEYLDRLTKAQRRIAKNQWDSLADEYRLIQWHGSTQPIEVRVPVERVLSNLQMDTVYIKGESLKISTVAVFSDESAKDAGVDNCFWFVRCVNASDWMCISPAFCVPNEYSHQL